MFFSAYFGRLDAMMVDLRKTCHLTEQDRAAQDTADADVWLDFQNAFKLIEMCGKVFTPLFYIDHCCPM